MQPVLNICEAPYNADPTGQRDCTAIIGRALETDKEGLLFVINRSPYDYDLEIAVKGYAPVKVKSGANRAVKKRLHKPASG